LNTILSFFILLIYILPYLINPAYAAIEEKNNKRIYAYLNAVNFYQNNNPDAAIKLLLVEQKSTPEHPLKNEINLMLAICNRETKNWEETLKYLSNVRGYESLNDYLIFFRAEALRELERSNESLELFEKIIKSYPKSIWFNSSLQNAFIINYDTKKYLKAIKLFRKYSLSRRKLSEEEKKLIPDIIFGYATSNLALKNRREAYRYFKKLVISYPNHPLAKKARSILYNNNIKFSSRGLITLIKSQIKSGLYVDASKNIKTLKKKNINKGTIAKLTADLMMDSRQWNRAIEELETVILFYPHPDAFYDMARCYSKLDNYSRARYYYRRLSEKYPKDNLATQAIYSIAKLYSLEGSYSEAIAKYRHLIKKYPRSVLIPSARWEIGWNYYSQENYDEAIMSWTKTSEMIDREDIIYSKLLYWRARAFLNKRDKRSASILFREVVSLFPFHYYSFLAQNRLIETTPDNLEIIHRIQSNLYSSVTRNKHVSCDLIDLDVFKDELSTDEKYYFSKTQNLVKVGLDKYASFELFRIQNSTKNKKILLNLAKFFHCLHDYNRAQYISRVFFKEKLETRPSPGTLVYWKLAFPRGYTGIISKLSDYLNVSPYLIYALMRAESNFKEKVVSRAGAIGLMQIIPVTGRNIARKLNDKNFVVEHLYDPKTNITFGTWYINSLIEKFAGNTILAIPGYNAGPHNVKRWVRQFGSKKVDEFVETIPYNETRNYIKRVVRNFGVYRALYSKSKSILRLSQNLHIDNSRLRLPAGKRNNSEDWDQYKESEDLRPKLYLINKFSLDKLSLIEYFSLNSFKRDVKAGSLWRR